MRSLITYYSYSGNTEKTANILAGILRQKGDVTIQRLKPKEEIASFLGQCGAAFTGKRSDLQDGIEYDASPYDLILIGCPVWAFAPTPAVNTYLDGISGLNGKKAVIFVTYGSGAGVKRCVERIKTVLKDNGAYDIGELAVQQLKTDDSVFVSSLFKKALSP
ncbi:MAG: NAD(P)H-dependent oxidoreductase [Candidatus Omnitrophica bacterium]|nr:NAD(P)H-dependent oxidoreductase [Candidatus Omnitrophota bacterium]